MNERPATRDDLPALVELFGAAEEAILHRPSRLDSDSVNGWLQTISFETNTWLFEEDDSLLAAAFAQLYGPRGVFAGAVRPSAQGQGYGTRLVDLAEGRLGAEGAERVHVWTLGGDDDADKLFRNRGYHEVRRFWEMAIGLDQEFSEPAVEIETFRDEDARAFHAALEEAFEDHWEHHPEPFDEWWSRMRGQPRRDPSLWFLVRDGDEIAAAVLNDPNRQKGGYVGALGVRRPWRGRGYGRALLVHSFRQFQLRGLSRAGLGVDAANPTGATRLYESAGMYVEQEHIIRERVLR